MLRIKEVITGVGTLGIAAGIGFAVESGETARDRYGLEGRPTLEFDGAQVPEQTDAGVLLAVQEIELTSAGGTGILPTPTRETTIKRVSAPATSLPELDRDAPPLSAIRTEDCVMTAFAKPLPGAMVDVTMSAPCARNERLTVHHHGLMFTMATDANGSLNMVVPAFKEQAVFIMAFANGDGAVAHTAVTDLANYHRVATQWRGEAGFQLHAREFGADYGKAGHIWSGGVAADMDALGSGKYGFMVTLGDADVAQSLVAEVYSFPAGMAKRDGTINLSVEAEVTAKNCGQEIEAQTIERLQAGALKTQDLMLAVPDCDAVGSFLVLNNLVSDLKVASN